MSPIMKRFLTAWAAWADAKNAGFTDCGPVHFSEYVGLCSNACSYVRDAEDYDITGASVPDYWEEREEGDADSIAIDTLREELSALFEADGLDVNYPFGVVAYDHALDNGTMHRCEARRNWVYDKVGA